MSNNNQDDPIKIENIDDISLELDEDFGGDSGNVRPDSPSSALNDLDLGGLEEVDISGKSDTKEIEFFSDATMN